VLDRTEFKKSGFDFQKNLGFDPFLKGKMDFLFLFAKRKDIWNSK
jgi:hypothetical protein